MYSKRKQQRRLLGARCLQAKVKERGGESGLALELELDPVSRDGPIAHDEDKSAGIYGQRRRKTDSSFSFHQTRHFHTPRTNINGAPNANARSVAQSTASRISRFSRTSTNLPTNRPVTTMAVHIVCAVSENLARETCVSSMDAGAPTSMYITKQGNGQTYAETIAYLEILKPDEVLLNEGRRNSQLARKIMELFNVDITAMELPTGRNHRRKRRRQDGDGAQEDAPFEEDRFGSLESSTVVKFISRSCFDQTKGAELLRRVAREETYDATMVEEYILLSSAHAVLLYVQTSLGASFLKNSIYLSINAGGSNRMAIDRATLLQLELLVNSKTGKVKDSLIGTMDCTKTTVGSRLLRANLMSPPARVDTINTRLELVDLFLSGAEFFYAILDHLSNLPDVDKVLSHIALVPRKNAYVRKGSDADSGMVNERIASKGIAALVCIKTTLQALPSFAGVLYNHLKALDNENAGIDDASVATDRFSLLVGLDGGVLQHLNRHHLLRAILFAMTQPALTTVLGAVSNIFTETTTFSRNAKAMRHQECFAFKCEEVGMMSVIRKAFLANVDDIYKKADEYAEVYGISVSIRYSTSRGYYLAVPVDVGTDLPQVFLQPAKSGRFINCTTEEITSLNTRAQDNVHDLLLMTHDRIQEVMDVARAHYDVIATLCDSVALLDLCHSFADNVLTQSTLKWCRPDVSDKSCNELENASAISNQSAGSLIIGSGRYPIDVSESAADLLDGVGFPDLIPNDTYASDDKFFTVITGINGSGKSTYLKQVALITILAHCGSYVTAEVAKIPIRDRVCCRIGNADDQEHNISTFMLEMKETAFICNNVTNRSLVLVDELGRATSNEDGVAIAWSMSEYLLKKGAMTFFVTHYPQLSCLASIYPSVQNIHMEATVTRGNNGEISYTHKAKPGACMVSTDYGVELAAACGWPAEVVENARAIQCQVEALLPDENLCHKRSLDQVSGLRTHAYEVLIVICQELKNLITDERAQSYASLRYDLSSTQERHVPHENEDLISAMDLLLFRGSRTRRGWSRLSSLVGEHGSVHSRKDADNASEAFDASPNVTSIRSNNDRRVTAETEARTDFDSDDSSSDLSSSSSSSGDVTSVYSSSNSTSNLDAQGE